MTEALRRVTLEAELPESLAAEMEQAVSDGEFAGMAEVVARALTMWSDERRPRADPEGWRAHVDEVRAGVAEADAHPEDDMDAELYFRELLGGLAADTSTPKAVEAAE